jgi:cytochrome P450
LAFGNLVPLEVDPPQHTAYRQVLQPLLRPQQLKKLSDDIRSVVTDSIDRIAERGHAEWTYPTGSSCLPTKSSTDVLLAAHR